MTKEERSTPIKKDDLVALLDGELSKQQTHDVKQVVGKDRRLRREVELLKQTWKLLDHLETPETDGDFTQNTVCLALQKAENASADKTEQNAPPRLAKTERNTAPPLGTESRQPQWGSLGPTLAWSLAFVGCFVTAFALAASWTTPDDRVIRDLPVIERLDEYRSIGDIEFLRQLHEKHILEAGEEPLPDQPREDAGAAEATS
ncbi:hypothetical protein [Planctomycetes bacterium Pan216]